MYVKANMQLSVGQDVMWRILLTVALRQQSMKTIGCVTRKAVADKHTAAVIFSHYKGIICYPQ